MMFFPWEKNNDNRIRQPTSFRKFVLIFCCAFEFRHAISPVNGIREHDDGRNERKLQTVGKFLGKFILVKGGQPSNTPLSDIVLREYNNASRVDLTPFNNVGLSLMIPFTCCFTSVTLTFNGITTVEINAPYALLGNTGQDFKVVPDLNVTGPKRVFVAGYSGSTLVATMNLTFVVRRSPLPPTVPVSVPVFQPVPIPVPTAPIPVPTAPIPVPTAPIPVPTAPTKPPLMLDNTKIVQVEGDRWVQSFWADSYSVGGQCFCTTDFDHGIGDKIVMTPLGNRTVRQICDLLKRYAPSKTGRPIYNDINCGNGPINDDDGLDEISCPGRVDYGISGCGYIGPKWNFTLLLP